MSHILIIDDSATETYVLKHLLEKQGYSISTACNGLEGIQVATIQQPDLIIMDVVMPGMNGFQATRELGKLAETRQIPVIIYSSKSKATDSIWGLRQGAKDYLVKPVKEDVLLASIEKHISVEKV